MAAEKYPRLSLYTFIYIQNLNSILERHLHWFILAFVNTIAESYSRLHVHLCFISMKYSQGFFPLLQVYLNSFCKILSLLFCYVKICNTWCLLSRIVPVQRTIRATRTYMSLVLRNQHWTVLKSVITSSTACGNVFKFKMVPCCSIRQDDQRRYQQNVLDVRCCFLLLPNFWSKITMVISCHYKCLRKRNLIYRRSRGDCFVHIQVVSLCTGVFNLETL
jgi:hypothetical protein